ncbi:MAG: hypothetical protein AAF790_12000, partial [Planctomycetota bacterium]
MKQLSLIAALVAIFGLSVSPLAQAASHAAAWSVDDEEGDDGRLIADDEDGDELMLASCVVDDEGDDELLRDDDDEGDDCGDEQRLSDDEDGDE